ncbi:MAG: adenylate/guanylate cyclase domain-containing protein [Planctomycetales bacterium]|nr:adenylate/guanylate cyclase domain-containing protein [Planctomycetales bacterium]
MKPLIATREITCLSPRDDLWVALGDTAQLNRAVGNNPLVSEPIESPTAARHLVKTRLYGLSLIYEERPFQWNRPESLSITRVFQNGPAFQYIYEHRLTEQPQGGSLVSLRIEIAPRWPLLWPFLWINTLLIANRLARQVKLIDANLQRGEEPYGRTSVSSTDSVTLSRSRESLLVELKDADLKVGEQLAQFVAHGADIEVSRIRPYEIADKWNVARPTMVSVCLQAVMAGMLDLSWDIICPSCRTVASQVGTLSDLAEVAHCHLCDISINVDLDRAVEATFRPSAAVRSLENRPYCIGGPFRTPHVVAQAILPAGGSSVLPVPDEPGRYRLFVRGGPSASIDVNADAPSEVEMQAGDTVEPAEVCIAPQGQVVVHDRLGRHRHVKLEHLQWASLATTAHYVSTVSEFRRLFSAKVLQPGLRVKVTRVALAFTDLTGSAAMYTRLGDALAYRFVQEHFALLEKVISHHGGSIVKTIGDAIMAVFAEECAAVQATIAMQQAFMDFARRQTRAENVQLCVGMYAGPCYLVSANKILDYFGQTVNIANRLQCQAEGGQIILPREIADCALAEGWLKGARIIGHFAADLKGLSESLAATRLVVYETPNTTTSL